jgi:hypothetical protein
MTNSVPKKISAVGVIGIAVFALLFFWSALVVVTFRIPETGASATLNSPRVGLLNEERMAVLSGKPRTGVLLNAGYYITRVRPGTPAARAGLRSGDLVVYARLKPDCSRRWYKCHPFRLFSGQPVAQFQLVHPVTLFVQRGSHSFYVTLDPGADSRPYPMGDFLTFFLRLIVYTAIVALGTWLALLRPGLMGLAFFATCVSLAAPTGLAALTFVEILQHGAPLDVFWNTSMAFQLAVIALPIFLLRFPNDTSPGWRRPMLIFALWAVPPLFLLSFLFIHYDYLADIKIPVFLVSFGIAAAMYTQTRGADRKRLQWAIAGIIAGIVAAVITDAATYFPAVENGARSMSMSILDESATRNVIINVATLLYTMMPICLIYAIVRHRVIDVRFITSRAIILGILLTVLVVVFVVLDWIFTDYVSQSLWRIAIGMAVAFGLGWMGRKSASHLVSWVDGTFFRTRYAAMTELRELRFALERETRSEEIQRIVIFAAAEALKLGSAALFVPAPDGGFIRQTAVGWTAGTAWHLFRDDPIVRDAAQRSKPFSLQGVGWNDVRVPRGTGEPALAVPLTWRRKLVALAVYGAHTSGAEIDPDEARLLREICAAAAFAYDRRVNGILATPAFAAEATHTARS